jgi:hypothetical protein
MPKQDLTQDRLHELLHYDSDTGLFTWTNTNLHKRTKDKPFVGNIWWSRKDHKKEPSDDKKYITIQIGKKRYLAHRLAWLFVYGWLPKEIDHIDKHGMHNNIKNLRASTHAQNLCNTAKYSNNTSGYKGVSFHKPQGLWKAAIISNGAEYQKYGFSNPKEAHEWYCLMAKQLHGEFARTS